MTASRRFGWLARAALLALAVACAATWLRAETLPPKPQLYFNDNASIVDAATAADLNEQLAQFERDTSSQIVVAIYPSLPAGADASQYGTQTYNSWVVDRKNGRLTGGSNGAALFVFVNDRKMFIATGRDLEGALPDITCEEIIRDQIEPAFKQGDYAGGLRANLVRKNTATGGGNPTRHLGLDFLRFYRAHDSFTRLLPRFSQCALHLLGRRLWKRIWRGMGRRWGFRRWTRRWSEWFWRF
jgi:uncharacterized membrane protein YgcG